MVADAIGAADTPALQRASAETVLELLAAGWIEIYECVEPLGASTIRAIDADTIERRLQDLAAWEPPPSGGLSLRFATTDAGERAHSAHAADPRQ